MRHFLTLVLFLASTVCFSQDTPADPKTAKKDISFLEQYREAATQKWEKAIVEIEQRDQSEVDPDDAVLFIGSSSIRRWESIKDDIKPYKPIQRGYGGAKFSDLAIYAERIIQPHQYKALVVFVGNDVSGRDSDHTPDQVEKLVRYVIDVSQAHQPKAPILIIEVTPTSKRFKAWPKIRELNARLREVTLTSNDTYFLPTAEYYLDAKGKPKDHLFVSDLLHLNSDGYKLWSKLIRKRLGEIVEK